MVDMGWLIEAATLVEGQSRRTPIRVELAKDGFLIVAHYHAANGELVKEWVSVITWQFMVDARVNVLALEVQRIQHLQREYWRSVGSDAEVATL